MSNEIYFTNDNYYLKFDLNLQELMNQTIVNVTIIVTDTTVKIYRVPLFCTSVSFRRGSNKYVEQFSQLQNHS